MCTWQTVLGIVGIASALAGVWLGSCLSSRREAGERRRAFVERQLREFYSPLLGMRSELRALGEVGLKVKDTADEAWREIIGNQPSAEAQAKLSAQRLPEFAKIVQYNNKQLRQALLPMYRTMVAVFRDNLSLAEPSTREHFATLVEFVELWTRSLDEKLPIEVQQRLSLEESKLQPFYENLEQTHDELRTKVKQGRA